jgi:hypothetical protein
MGLLYRDTKYMTWEGLYEMIGASFCVRYIQHGMRWIYERNEDLGGA